MSQTKHFISHVKTPRGTLLVCALGALVLAAGGALAIGKIGAPGVIGSIAPVRANVASLALPHPWSDPKSLVSLGISETDWDSTQAR